MINIEAENIKLLRMSLRNASELRILPILRDLKNVPEEVRS